MTDKDRPFVGHVPSVRIHTGDSGQATAKAPSGRPLSQRVVDGLGTFHSDWCSTRPACDIVARHGFYGRDEGPCPGHGYWDRPPIVLTLTNFVAHVLRGTIRLHHARAEQPWNLGRHRPGKFLWTTRQHWLLEREQVYAGEAAVAWAAERKAVRAQRQKRENDRLAAIAALEARQAALVPPAVELVKREARGYVGVRDSSPDWAMGVPLLVHDMPQGVIAPVPSRVKGAVRERLRGLTVFVASEQERDRLIRICIPGQRIVLFDFDFDFEVEVPTLGVSQAGISPRQAANITFGRGKHYR